MYTRLLDYSEGGPNDPRTTFNDLRKWLTAVKEDRLINMTRAANKRNTQSLKGAFTMGLASLRCRVP